MAALTVPVLTVSPVLDVTGYRDLAADAIITISSAKPGNGVEQLRDGNLETFWQSDGQAPHLINIQFLKKSSVCKVCFHVDFNLDESYTAKKVSVRSGTTQHDLLDVASVDLADPVGWCSISLTTEDENGEAQPLRTHLLQIRILSMHQNGRDTHLRALAVLGPRPSSTLPVQSFQTSSMMQYATPR